ncbi:tspO/MBR-related protein [Artemisia annua]|uniref:TspO/MBR-related protein n=1 Tax=Artemisia annua TaxID=35608 RepID=A0A2U1PRN4_ARTAN|nr:tspO/MBR-related protein [Artemisia annua]
MTYNVSRTRSQKKPSTASRGIRSLSLAIAVPVGLTLTIILMSGENDYKNLDRPFWIPPLWAIQLTCLSSAFVMGLSAWLVWAESGFHRSPVAIVIRLNPIAGDLVKLCVLWIGFLTSVNLYFVL